MSQPRVAELWRFPVKSFVGEQVQQLQFDARGAEGDRAWSVYTAEGKLGSGKAGRRFAALPGLLEIRAATVAGQVQVTFPDGTTESVAHDSAADKVSAYVGHPVTLAAESVTPHFDDGAVSLMGSASLAALERAQNARVDRRRFRANVVLETTEAFVEDTWVGRDILVGTLRLRVDKQLPRCVMVDMETADLPSQTGNLTTLGRINDACMGILASVVTPGVVVVGDELRIADPSEG